MRRLRGNYERRTLDKVESKMMGPRRNIRLSAVQGRHGRMESSGGWHQKGEWESRWDVGQDPECSLDPVDELVVEASP